MTVYRCRIALAPLPALCVAMLVSCQTQVPARKAATEKPAADATSAPAPAPEPEPEPAKAPATRRAIMAYSWSLDKDATYDHIVAFHWLKKKGLDAAAAKAATDAQPEGHRSLFSWDLHRAIGKHPEDVCRTADGEETKHRGIWWDHGVAEVAAAFDAFFAEYKKLGGELDVFVLDFEGGMSNWQLGKDPERYRAIAADPRFPEIARELGFDDLLTVCEWWKTSGPERQRYLIWNALMQERVAAYVSQAVYEPIRKHFPDVIMSNYGDCYHSAKFPVPDLNGHAVSAHRGGAHVGTHQSRALYCSLGQVTRLKLDGHDPYEKTPFNAFRFSLNHMRSMALASDVPTQPWVSHWNFTGSVVRGSDLYKELVYHTILAGADEILYWNPRPWRKDQDPAQFADAAQDRLMNDMLALATDLVGYADRTSLQAGLVPWGAAYALSGMAAGGRTVWRFTPAPAPGRTLRMLKEPAGVVVDDVRIVIPGGTFHTPEKPLSRLGWWIVAPLDARPVISKVEPKAKPTGPDSFP